MAHITGFNRKRQALQGEQYLDPASPFSNDVHNDETVKLENWKQFFSYYRYYIDKFAINVLKQRVYPFQRLILRAMMKYQYSMCICCRGIGKSWLVALFMICIAILYPGIKIGIASGKGQQARNVIIQKIKGELKHNENIAREIRFPIKTTQDDCVVNFKNGSEIRAIVLGQNQNGESARSWRFNLLLIDEARLVKDDVVEAVLIPMTKTKRQRVIDLQERYPELKMAEKGKVIFISSAYLKTCDLYKRFMYYYNCMISGDKNFFVCSLDYKVGVDARLFDEEDILSEKDKPTMTIDKWTYEYDGVFVGSSSESFYPYDLTIKTRVIESPELSQPKKSKSEYVITHDVAISDAKNSDNACTHVIKLKPKPNGSYIKEVVYTKTMNGVSLRDQKEFLRELMHIKFPNTKMLVIDAQSSGEGLLALFAETWEHKNENTKEVTEYPPLVDDISENTIEGASKTIRAIQAYANFNNDFYPYMKNCFEDGTLRLLTDSADSDDKYKLGEISPEEQLVHVEHDLMISELSNIKQEFTDSTNRLVYTRIIKRKKRDRATSLMYGLSYIFELEEEARKKLFQTEDDAGDIIKCVFY